MTKRKRKKNLKIKKEKRPMNKILNNNKLPRKKRKKLMSLMMKIVCNKLLERKIRKKIYKTLTLIHNNKDNSLLKRL